LVNQQFKENIMKLLLALVASLALVGTSPAFAGGEKKEVCETQKDKKTGKEKQVCKTIKVHKKVEGDKVPDGKKK
jgi:hypothetical protein